MGESLANWIFVSEDGTTEVVQGTLVDAVFAFSGDFSPVCIVRGEWV